MKKYFKYLIVFQLIFCVVMSCSVQGFCAENNNYNYLLSCGYPEEFLNKLTDTTIDEIVKLHGDNKVIDIICETEYWPENKPDNAKVIINSIIAVMQNPEGDKIAGESICVYWEWVENKPLVKGEDFISILYSDESLIFEADTFYAEDYWKEKEEEKWNVSDSYRSLARANMNTLGYYTDLKEFKKYVGGSAVFNLLANSPIEVNSDYNKYFSVEYEHNVYYELIIFSVVFFGIVQFQIIKRVRKKK